jgi:hydrogenase nickel incorporation protein HypA/HybF
MHELGIVVKVIDTLEALGKEQALSQVTSVTLDIGEVSGVLPDYLTDCWKWAHVRSMLLKEAQLKINTLPAVTLCEDCGGNYSTVKYAKKCPYCGSENTSLLHGNEFTIKEIEAC